MRKTRDGVHVTPDKFCDHGKNSMTMNLHTSYHFNITADFENASKESITILLKQNTDSGFNPSATEYQKMRGLLEERVDLLFFIYRVSSIYSVFAAWAM